MRRWEVRVPDGLHEGGYVGFAEGTVPAKAFEMFAMFVVEGVIVEQGCSQLLKDLTDNLPVGGTEVSAKGLVAEEEQLVRNDVREGPYDIRV